MCPTSIAVLKLQRAAAVRAAVALGRLAQVGEARLEVAPRLDAAQVPAVAVRAGDELPVAQRLVGDDLALEADRAERAAARAERGADLLVGRRARRQAERGVELRRLDAVVAADRARARRPSSVVTGIAFDVAATSIDEELGERLARLHAGRLDLLGRSRASRGRRGRAATVRATSRSAAKSPFSHVTSVFSPAPAGARKSNDSLPPIIPDSASTLGELAARSARRCGGTRRAAARSSSRARPRRGRTSTRPSSMNSRSRISPARGRGSSRSFVEKW